MSRDKIKDDNLIHFAIKIGHVEIVDYLVQKGIEITYLLVKVAIDYDRLEIIKYFFEEKNIDIDLEYAIIEGRMKIVEYLLSKGFSVNNFPLHYSIRNGNLELIKLLVENGAKTNLNKGETSNIASKYGKLDIVKYLVENGIDKLE